MHYYLYVSLILILLISDWGKENIQTEIEIPDTNKIDQIFEEFTEPGSPGCALGVNLNQELVYSKGYGVANLDYDIPITPDSRFMIASNSKQFAAAAMLMMAQEGYFDLDEDLRPYISQISQFESPITARQIINHTSGIRDIYTLLSVAGIGLDNRTTKEAALEMLSNQSELNFEPGSEYSYSNMAYFLISEIVEVFTGSSLKEYSELHFFEPIGMTSTHWHDNTEMIVPDRALSYLPTNNGPGLFFRKNMDRVGARGIVVTIKDFAKWDNNYYDNKSNLENFTEKMEENGILTSGEPINYSAGLRLAHHNGFKTVGHGGNYMGFKSHYIRFPEQNLSVIVFCNMSSINPADYAFDVADLFLENEIKSQFGDYVNRYRNDNISSEFSFLFDEGKPSIQFPGKQPQELSWVEDDTFEYSRFTLTFDRNDVNEITSATLKASNTGPISFEVES